MQWIPWLSAILLAACASATLHWLLNPPQPIGWRALTRPIVPPRDPIPRAWLELTQLPITPQHVVWFNRAVGLSVAIWLGLWTLNPIVAIAIGSIAMPLPEAIIRMYARRQWQLLDRLAYLFTQNIAFFLDQGIPTLEAFRYLHNQRLDPPLDGWILEALVAEGRGEALQDVIKERAGRIHHIELMLLGDILTAERTTGHASHLVARLIQFWAARLDADAKRRGQLKMSMMVGYLMVFGGALGFLAALIAVPALAQAAHHGVGWIITSAGAGLIAIAAHIQQNTARKAETV